MLVFTFKLETVDDESSVCEQVIQQNSLYWTTEHGADSIISFIVNRIQLHDTLKISQNHMINENC